MILRNEVHHNLVNKSCMLYFFTLMVHYSHVISALHACAHNTRFIILVPIHICDSNRAESRTADQIERILQLFIFQTSWGEAQHEYSEGLLQMRW